VTRIIAVCDEEQGCPLYRRDNRLDFSPPIVTGIDGVPVCSTAVESLHKPVVKIQAGEASIYAAILDGADAVEHKIGTGRQVYVHVIRGSVKVNGIDVSGGDAVHVDKEAGISLTDAKDSEVLVFDLPY
jgi:redox-sensitive bicupin YhaK (pirin superfamily)